MDSAKGEEGERERRERRKRRNEGEGEKKGGVVVRYGAYFSKINSLRFGRVPCTMHQLEGYTWAVWFVLQDIPKLYYLTIFSQLLCCLYCVIPI
jgi:hypothetical protein